MKKILLLCLVFCVTAFSSFNSATNRTVCTDSVLVKNMIADTISDSIPPLNYENLKAELIRRNIPCYDIVLAQAILETGNFTSRYCRERNNLFGMRTSKGYKSYASWIDCVADYERRFSKRYKGGDYYLFLKKCRFAEDPYYGFKVRRLVQKNS